MAKRNYNYRLNVLLMREIIIIYSYHLLGRKSCLYIKIHKFYGKVKIF